MALTSGSAGDDTDPLKESSFDIFVKPKMPVGVVLSQATPPKIMQLLPNSPMLGKLFVNDLIISVDEKPVRNTPMFIQMIRAATGRKVIIKYKRNEGCSSHTRTLPVPRPGWESFEIEMHWRKAGIPVGILVHQDSYGRVIISMVPDGTVASKTLKPGDVVLKINDEAVPDKNAAKKMIMESVQTKNCIKLTMERQVELIKPKIMTATTKTTSPNAATTPNSASQKSSTPESGTVKSPTSVTTTAPNKTAAVPSSLPAKKTGETVSESKETPKKNAEAVSTSTLRKPEATASDTKVADKDVSRTSIQTARSDPSETSCVTPAEKEAKKDTSTMTAIPKRIHKPGPKLPNCDFCLPKDVLQILATHKDFYKSDCSNPPILRNTGQEASGPRINLTAPAPGEEEKIVFDPGEGPLKQTPKRC